LGIIIPTDFHIFQDGENHQPVLDLGTKKMMKMIQKSPMDFFLTLPIFTQS